MTRPTSPALLAAAAAPVVRPFLAAELDYPAGTVRVCSLPTSVVIGGQTFYGTGAMGQISAITDGAETRSYGFTLELSGIPGDWGQYLREQDVQGRAVTIHLGFCAADHTVIGSEVINVGRMDTQDVTTGTTTSIKVNCEGLSVDWERARIRRCTDVDHQAAHPGDKFFQYVAAMENINLVWGKA